MGLVLGLLNPKLTMRFGLPQKRSTSCSIFSGSLILSFIMFAVTVPDDAKFSSSKFNKEVVIPKESVEKWVALEDSKKEKYIRKQILGKWILLFSLIRDNESQEISRIDYQGTYRKKGDKIFTESYDNNENISILLKNDAPLISPPKSTYLVNENILEINTSTPLNTITEKYTVGYIGSLIFIRSGFDENTNRYSTDVFYKPGNYLNELSELTSNQRSDAYKRLKQGDELIKKRNFFDAYTEILDGISNLQTVSLFDKSYSLAHDNKADVTINNLKEVDKQVTPLYLKGFKLKFDSISKPLNSKSPDYRTYFDSKPESATSMLLSFMNTRKFVGLNNTPFLTLYKREISRFKKAKADYAIYGDGDDIFMKGAAELFINELDPNFSEIQTAFKSRKSKQGWIYYVQYKTKNMFGVYILQSVELLMGYSSEEHQYFVRSLI